MSILDQLNIAVQSDWLVNVEPTLPGTPRRRVIFAAKKLWDDWCADLEKKDTAMRTSNLMANLDYFLSGGRVTIGRRKFTDSFLKLLCPGQDEVWEIRSTSPKPSIRVFGRFAAQDVFVATNFEYRNRMHGFGSKEFSQAIETCKSEWRKAMSTYQPLTGAYPNEYISENFVDIESI